MLQLYILGLSYTSWLLYLEDFVWTKKGESI